MSACPVVTSPIQRLNFDILWRIFDINADMFEDHRALRTTLATSRVCHSWRFLLLSSSSIWAHLIDLDHWIWRRVKGSHEMIRRTGTAFLWVKSRRLVVSDIIFRHLFYFRQTTGCESRGSKLWRSKCTKNQARTTLMSAIYFSCIYPFPHYFSLKISCQKFCAKCE